MFFILIYCCLLLVIFINRVLCNEKYDKYINVGFFYYLFCKDFEQKLFYDTMKDLIDSNARVLDFGCGPGIISEFFGNNYIGIDIDETRIIQARKMYETKQFLLVDESSKKLPFYDNQFDVILCNDCLHHISDSTIQQILPEWQRVLSENGVIIIREPKKDTYFLTYFITEIFENGYNVRTTTEYKNIFTSFDKVFEKSYYHYVRDYYVLIVKNKKKTNIPVNTIEKINHEKILIDIIIILFFIFGVVYFTIV
jgi:ubiquinone/menaquinone biosynthesis C-methylase UbiE